MKKFAIILFVVALGAGLLFACTQPQGTQETKSQDKPAADKPVEGDIAAWVNGKPIPKKLVDDVIESMPPMYQAQVKSPEGIKNLVENLVNVELVFAKAEKDGFTKKPEIVDKIKAVTKQVVYASFIEDAVKNQATDEEAMKKFYEDNKAQFQAKAQVQASHILFKTAQDGSDDAAKKKACDDVLGKAKKPGADFAALAGQYSDDSSKAKGGDLGFFEREAMVKPFADAAFEMKVGDVKGCVKSRFGYHIIKKVADKAEGQRSFDEVKDQLAEVMKRQGQQKAFEDLIQKIRQGADIKYNNKLLGLPEDAPAAPAIPGAAPAAPAAPAKPAEEKK